MRQNVNMMVANLRQDHSGQGVGSVASKFVDLSSTITTWTTMTSYFGGTARVD
jgi:hypothetical protein